MEPITQTIEPVPAPEKRIGKLRGSFLLVSESFALLRKDKEIMLFPVLTFFTSLLLLILAGAVLFSVLAGMDFSEGVAEEEYGVMGEILLYAGMFVLYLVGAFISAFFQAGIVTIVHARLNGRDLGFKDGIRNASAHAGKIFVWSLFAATVGVILEFIASKFKWLGFIVANLLGTAWNIITLFIVPVLVLEEGSVKDAIRRSGSIFKQRWGETLIMSFSTGLFFLGVFFAGLLVYLSTWFLGNETVIIASTVLFVFFVIGVSVLSSTLNIVYKVVLYEYAASGIIPDSFTPELVTGAVKVKKPKA
ncbi:MAG: DUF6159 family protein [Patescibacteria group bacterium]